MTEVTLEAVKQGGNIYSVARFTVGEKDGLLSDEVMAELIEEVNAQGVRKPLFRALVDLFNQRDDDEGDTVPETETDF